MLKTKGGYERMRPVSKKTVEQVAKKLMGSDRFDKLKEEREARVPKIFGDFTEPPEPKDQAIALIFGLPGEGKTTFALSSAPGPIAFFDVDRRGLHAARRAKAKGKRIAYTSLDYPKNLLKMGDVEARAAAQKQVDKYTRNYELALRESERGNIRTIVTDTWTELAEIFNIALTGRVDRKKDDYGKSAGLLKASISRLLKESRNSDANILMLARAKEVWEGGSPTGIYTFKGPDTLAYDADWAGHYRLSKARSIRRQRDPSRQVQELEITKAGINRKTLGRVYTREDWGTLGPFIFACMKSYPGTTAETWR
jgi:hypothetical protein